MQNWAEDGVEQVFGGGLADDFSDGVGGDAQIQGGEFKAQAGGQRGGRAPGRLAGAAQGVLMTGVDHHLQHFSTNFAGPNALLDGGLQFFDPFSREAANRHGFPGGRQLENLGQIGLVAHEDARLAGKLGEEGFVGGCLRLVRSAHRHPTLAGLTAAAVLSLATGTVVSTYFKIQADARAADARTAALEAKASATEADRRRGESEAAGATARDRLSRLNIATGTRYLDAGDADSAVLWYARAWSTDNDPAAEEGHRLRVGAALAARPELVGLGIHNAAVSDALFSPLGARILTRIEGPEAYIWDYERGRLAVPPLGHEAKVCHAAWNDDGTLVATASDDRAARIWNAHDGRMIRILRHPDGVRWLAFARFCPAGDRVRRRQSADLDTASAPRPDRRWSCPRRSNSSPTAAMGRNCSRPSDRARPASGTPGAASR